MRSAGSNGSGDGARWRVFISHTSELRNFPRGQQSYVAEVERAISAAGHVVVDMADFPAADQLAARVCIDTVRGCDVYVGVLGTRYGSPVRDKPEVSYTELEFDTATQAEMDRLVFLLDTNAESVGIPLSQLIDREYGDRQDAFRRKVRASGLTTQSFANPAKLGQLVERSLRERAETIRRIDSGIQREQVPAEPQPVRASKFVNPPPATAPTWFQDRQVETGLLARYVRDPGIRMVTVVGRGGIGKTAMVCRLLKLLEAGRIPDIEGDLAKITVGGIVYLSRNGTHKVEYPTLVADLLRLLPVEAAQRLQRLYQDPHHTPQEMMLALLEAFPVGEPVVVLLDNLESVMDTEREILTEQALHEALSAVLTAPAHAVTVIATTRVTPTALLKVEPASQRRLRLEKGLGSPDAETVLRELDDDGRLGLRDAPDALLDGLRRHTRGFPRALEAVKAILDGDDTLTPQDLLDRTRDLPEDRVVQVLVGEAYQLLDTPAQQVMQALSVFPSPVSAVGVDFLLRPVNPTTDAAPILSRLVRRQLVRFQDRHYHLHPLDRDYVRSQLHPGSPGDAPAAFTLTGLQARAADYYTQIRTPRESWRSLVDVRPQLAEFELRCDTGDYDTAATVLSEVDVGYLQVWGHYRTLVDLHGRIHGQITDPKLNATHLTNLGFCYYRLGEYRQAIELYTQALAILRDLANRQGEGAVLANLGLCQMSLGEYRQAVELHTQALAILRDFANRQGEGAVLANLGNCHMRLGEFGQAVELHTQALAILRDLGDRYGEGMQLGNLGNCRYDLGEFGQAIELYTQALTIARDLGNRYGEANALNYLGRAWLASGDVRQAVTLLEQAVSVADTSGNIEPAVEARSGLARAQLQLGDAAAALAVTAAGPELSFPTEEPTMRLLEGLALLELDRVDEGVRVFSDALRAADALLALADRNVAALRTRALALSGLAAASGDPTRATEAVEAFARADTVIRAAGVVTDTHRLLDAIAAHDRTGILAEVRAAQDL
jgi:tetratricopeptide (TPR) repeat protein